jgi:hypothetical protein
MAVPGSSLSRNNSWPAEQGGEDYRLKRIMELFRV